LLACDTSTLITSTLRPSQSRSITATVGIICRQTEQSGVENCTMRGRTVARPRGGSMVTPRAAPGCAGVMEAAGGLATPSIRYNPTPTISAPLSFSSRGSQAEMRWINRRAPSANRASASSGRVRPRP